MKNYKDSDYARNRQIILSINFDVAKARFREKGKRGHNVIEDYNQQNQNNTYQFKSNYLTYKIYIICST